jgi:hypothetical protein
MPGDQLSAFSPAVSQEPVLPPAVLLFLRLCLVAGLFNDFLIFALVLLNPHQSHAEIAALQSDPDTSVFALRLAGGFVLCAMMLPLVLLPYWLGLAVVYARNMWAQGVLYFGAGVYLLMSMGVGIKQGLFSAATSGLLVETGLGVAALVCLGRAPMRDWLRYSVPAFVPRIFHS